MGVLPPRGTGTSTRGGPLGNGVGEEGASRSIRRKNQGLLHDYSDGHCSPGANRFLCRNCSDLNNPVRNRLKRTPILGVQPGMGLAQRYTTTDLFHNSKLSKMGATGVWPSLRPLGHMGYLAAVAWRADGANRGHDRLKYGGAVLKITQNSVLDPKKKGGEGRQLAWKQSCTWDVTRGPHCVC